MQLINREITCPETRMFRGQQVNDVLLQIGNNKIGL